MPVNFELLDHQAEFVFSDKKFVLLEGGYGNGKSTAGFIKLAVHCQENPGTKVGLFREDRADLKKSTLSEWKDLFGDHGNYNGQEDTFYFDNGSTVIFHQLSELRKLRNHNLSAALIEQAEETTESAFWYLVGRLRRDDADSRWIGLLCNPEGHDWIWRLFYENDIPKPDPGTVNELQEMGMEPPGPEDFHKISASTFANKDNLPPDYLQGLAGMNETDQAKYVHGSRDVLEGAVYPYLRRDTHLIDPFEIPEDWPKWTTLDYGDTNPTACLWVTVDYDDRIFIYREHHKGKGDDGKDWIISEHSRAIIQAEQSEDYPCPYKEHVRHRLIDPGCTAQIREKGQSKISVQEEFAQQPFPVRMSPWRRANGRKEKLAQINRVNELFKPRDEFTHPVTGQSPAPQAYILKTCPKTWEEHTQYHWKEQPKRLEGQKNLPEEPAKVDDHSCDAFRGWAAHRYMGPKKTKAAPPGSFDYVRNKALRRKKNKKRNQQRFRVR